MNKIITLCTAALLYMCGTTNAYSQDSDYGYFNSIAIGVNAGTTGFGFDVATPIGNYLQLRVGMNMMPDISYDEDLQITVNASNSSIPELNTPLDCNVKGSLKRSTTDILLNIYPFRRSSFFIAGGISIGGKELVKLNGHSDQVAQIMDKYGQLGESLGIEIGDYNIPFNKSGNVAGGIKVAQTRPYLGLGFGRAVPKKRIGFMFELGAQFHGTPEIYTDYGSLKELTKEADNKYTDIINDVKIYPVLKFRLCGRIL